MMPQCQPGAPFDGEPSRHSDHAYALWDAAYVLGSLSRADRLEFEAHMRGCVSCREAAAELTGMPALLSQLDQNQMTAINEGANASAAPRPPEALTSLLAKVAWRRRRSHLIAGTAAAAVALLLCGFVTDAAHSSTFVPQPAQTSVSTAELTPAWTAKGAPHQNLSDRGVTRTLLGAAMAIQLSVAHSALVVAEPNSKVNPPKPFSGLSCDCHQAPTTGEPSLSREIARGLRDARFPGSHS